MAATTTVLLMLTVMVVPVYLQQNCSVVNTTASSGNFTLTVTPATYIANTNYTVTVNGTGNVTYVSLQVTEVGSNNTGSSWTTNNVTNTCRNNNTIYMNGSVPLVAYWKSSNGTSATIRALITVNSNTTYIVVQDLNIVTATTTSNPTTVTTATQYSNKTSATTAKPTNSANSASYSSWILIALLLSAYMVVKNRVMY